ncbi:hypothetical protein [Lacrimispora amygdalina]|uniref:hypothetical protein n=1 Tax=Lacrimispora TaxID=2719231 RepID=UPI001FA87053
MRNRLIIDGNAVYEIDDECMKQKQNRSGQEGTTSQASFTRPGQNKGQSRG